MPEHTASLAESEARYRAFVLATSDVVYRMSADWRVMIGLEGQNFVARDKIPNPNWLAENIFPDDREKVWEAVQEAIRNKTVFEMEHRVVRVDGTVGWTFSRAIPLLTKEGEIKEWFGVARDITDAKHAVEQIKESEKRLRFMADSMPQKVFTTTPSGEADYYNAQWLEFTGLSAQQIGQWGWGQFIHPDDLDQTLRLWRQAIETGEDFQIEQRFRRHDGIYCWHLSRAKAMRDPQGKVLMWIGSSTDITELVKARETVAERRKELEELVEERTTSLRKAVEEMEEFSYSVSHDLRAPLRSILGFAEILRDDCGEKLEDSEKEHIARIISGVSRMDRLTRDVLRYSKVGQSAIELIPLSLEPLVDDCMEQYSHFSSGQAQLVVNRPLHEVIAHEPLLMQTLSNLVGNALKFVAEGKMPQIQIYTEQRDGWIRLYVKDNGIGISRAHQSRIWGIFERIQTNGAYDGTGIGLAIVRKAVQRMGGSVGVESDGQSGSKFWLELPQVPTSSEAADLSTSRKP